MLNVNLQTEMNQNSCSNFGFDDSNSTRFAERNGERRKHSVEFLVTYFAGQLKTAQSWKAEFLVDKMSIAITFFMVVSVIRFNACILN